MSDWKNGEIDGHREILVVIFHMRKNTPDERQNMQNNVIEQYLK